MEALAKRLGLEHHAFGVDDGDVAISRARLPEAYTFTALASLAAIERIMSGDAPVGYQTPSTAFGADFLLDVEGVVVEDVTNPDGPATLLEKNESL